MAWNAAHYGALEGVGNSLGFVLSYGGQLIQAVEHLESVYKRVSGKIDAGHFYIPTDTQDGLAVSERPDEGDLRPSERESRRQAMAACLRVRNAVHLAKEAVARVASIMDSERDGLPDRWSVRTIEILRRIGGATQKGHARDFYPSALPMIRAGVPDALRKYLTELARPFEQVKSAFEAQKALRPDPHAAELERAIAKQRAIDTIDPEDLASPEDNDEGETQSPRPITTEQRPPITDADMRRALETLGGARFWGIDQLPADIDAAMLRCLDNRGWLDARIVTIQNVQKYPGDTTPPVPMPGPWFSPIQQPKQAGDWDKLAGKRGRDAWNQPPEVRVSERGKAALSRPEPAASPERTERKRRKPKNRKKKISRKPSAPEPTSALSGPIVPPADVQLVRVADVAKVVYVRSDKVLTKLRVRKYPVWGVRGSFQADLEHVIVIFPHKKKTLREWAERGFGMGKGDHQ